MKNIIFCICAIALMTLNSCQEREGCTDTDAVNYDVLAQAEDNSCTFPNVLMRFVPMINDSSRLGFGQDYMINGLNVRFDQIRFYVTDIALVTSKENFESEATLLATEADKSYDIGELKIGDLQQVKFNVGVDSIRNQTDPETQAEGSPLSANSPEIQHWDEDGYKFLIIEGSVDVNGDGDYAHDIDVLDTSEFMSIHCGLDSNLKNISLPVTELTIDEVGYELSVELEVRKIFEGYDLPNQLVTRPDNNPQFAVEIMNNIENVFSIQ